ncbi:dihydrodipicolinate synthase family protein [Streptomyces sp. NBC_01012]|uniref:dihydrodipicolinate synthase family protein n=1 Tax=Streptomyces sp. NBC_01012 TaxID=2903717 RepID=UPI0038703C7E|nr:dihydrodipicolinate synthase family protein [Streptomyces sp. NBC_01012]
MDLSALRSRLATVVAITPTPFTDEDEVDRSTLERVVARLVEGEVGVVTVNGNTGEFYCLTPAERRTVLEVVAAGSTGRALLLAGVGFDVATAIDDARFARDRGAEAIMVHQPVHPYLSAEGWVEYHRSIAAAVPDLGVVPYVKNTAVGPDQFEALADTCPNVVAVKYALPDTAAFAVVARQAGLERFTWIAGLAELSAPGYAAVGARGFTSGLASIAPHLSTGMHRALTGGDYDTAMKIWDSVREFEELRLARNNADNVSVIKEALHQIDLGSSRVRPPSAPPTPQIRERVTTILQSWGVK